VARQVRVAVARIDALALAQARRRLGPRDRRRYARFASTKRRREFLAGRALLQSMGLRCDSSPAGGIRVPGRAGASVSHARGWVACVVVSSGRPGIDIEPMIERDFAKLGEWAFGAGGSREEFYERWTRYEARIKAFGDGKPRASHIERTYFLAGGVALSLCVPASFASARWLVTEV
jgi:phosphopantetheinyl transferase